MFCFGAFLTNTKHMIFQITIVNYQPIPSVHNGAQ